MIGNLREGTMTKSTYGADYTALLILSRPFLAQRVRATQLRSA
jgi:hypothetical protein